MRKGVNPVHAHRVIEYSLITIGPVLSQSPVVHLALQLQLTLVSKQGLHHWSGGRRMDRRGARTSAASSWTWSARTPEMRTVSRRSKKNVYSSTLGRA